jgi:hypothetical protein
VYRGWHHKGLAVFTIAKGGLCTKLPSLVRILLRSQKVRLTGDSPSGSGPASFSLPASLSAPLEESRSRLPKRRGRSAEWIVRCRVELACDPHQRLMSGGRD